MPHTLVYWAPELLKLEEYTEKADMWALGVTFYQIVTGEHPFNVNDEETFRVEALSANVDWSKLEGYPLLKDAIFNLIKVNPERRWSSMELQRYIQDKFAVDVQRLWRGHDSRKEYWRRFRALLMIQSHVRGFIGRLKY